MLIRLYLTTWCGRVTKLYRSRCVTDYSTVRSLKRLNGTSNEAWKWMRTGVHVSQDEVSLLSKSATCSFSSDLSGRNMLKARISSYPHSSQARWQLTKCRAGFRQVRNNSHKNATFSKTTLKRSSSNSNSSFKLSMSESTTVLRSTWKLHLVLQYSNCFERNYLHCKTRMF